MDFWLWLLYLLPVSGALKTLPEVNLDGVVGGSVVIECPLPGETQVRMYLCRQMTKSGICATVVSNNFVKEEYRDRVILQPCSDRNLFLVEMTELTERDSGIYACGLGMYTERGKTQKVTLNVHSDYEPFWEEEQMPESQKWLHKLLQQQMPEWFQRIANAWSPEFIPKVATPDQRTEAPPVPNSSTTTLTTHQPQTSRVSSAAAAKPPSLLPSTTASKISAQEGVYRPQEASYKHHAWLHRQRASNPSSQSGTEDEGFHILLIPSVLGLLLMALLGLLIRRAIQRRRGERRTRPHGERSETPRTAGDPGRSR